MLKSRDNFTLFLIVLFLSGVYLFIFSESGALERKRYNEKRNEILSNIDNVRAEKKKLELESKNGLNNVSDGELFRSGYIRDGSKVLFIDPGGEGKPGIVEAIFEDDIGVDVTHLRVVWIVISSLVLLLYMVNRYRNREEL